MNSVNDKPIGIFDSGIGGLTVARELHRKLPGEDIIYLGDTARVPYGVKSQATITRYALECALFLLSKGVKLVVAACNTVSAVALPRLRELLRTPLTGVLEPGVKAALSQSKTGCIGLIGTPSTVESNAYSLRLSELDQNVEVWSQACPLLVPLAEEGRLEGPIVDLVLQEYLSSLPMDRIDTLILGCTHYPLFKPALNRLLDDDIKLVDSAETTAVDVKEMLLREGLIRTHGKGSVQCFVTDLPREFKTLAKLFFGSDLDQIRREVLGDDR